MSVSFPRAVHEHFTSKFEHFETEFKLSSSEFFIVFVIVLSYVRDSARWIDRAYMHGTAVVLRLDDIHRGLNSKFRRLRRQ